MKVDHKTNLGGDLSLNVQPISSIVNLDGHLEALAINRPGNPGQLNVIFDEFEKERSINTDEVYQTLLERMRNKPPKSDPTRLVNGDDFKIVGGQDVTNHTWPFLVNIGNFCMGSIIGKLLAAVYHWFSRF